MIRPHPHPRKTLLLPIAIHVAAAFLFVPAAWSQVPAPEAFFGFQMGTHGRLASWSQIQRYFERVAAESDRVVLADAGPTTEGHRLIAALVSAPENIARLDAIQSANRRLANPLQLSDEEAARLAEEQKVVVAIGSSIHATEIGATQAANELLYELATGDDDRTRRILRDVVLVLFPSLNPDGHTLVVDWYEQHRGTPFEASPMPWLYHRYAGHDLNRDGFMLNLVESRSLARFFYREWHPQVFLTMHQMGLQGPRFFVPPNYDPIDSNYDPLIWRQAGLLGHAMALELEREGRAGVVSNALFDYWWPGYEDSAPLGRNVVCLLTEAAGVRLALPVSISPRELSGSLRGLPEYRPQVNFPNPWPGGVWRLRDIVEYELIAIRGLLEAASRYRDQLVYNFYLMGRRAIDAGLTGAPFAFIIPPEQHDIHATAKLVDLLIEGAVEVHSALEPFEAGGTHYPVGTWMVLLAQPFRAYVKTLLERQDYPIRQLARGAPAERPYDAAAWTLPYQMGVDVVTVEEPFELPALERVDRALIPPAQVWGDRRPDYYVVDARGNGGAIAINRLLRAGLEPAWIRTRIEIEGYQYPTASIAVRHSRRSAPIVADIATRLGLRATGVRGRMPANLLPISRARVALYQSWIENIDEGWTRWLLEQYEFPYERVTDQDVRGGRLRDVDVLILPDSTADRMIAGHRPGTIPPEYAGGLGITGGDAIRTFVESGGTLVALNESTGYAIDLLRLPVRDVVRTATDSIFAPGSILRLEVDSAHPLAFGMAAESAAFFLQSSAFEVDSPSSLTNGHSATAGTSSLNVVARYGERDLLLSGWLEGEKELAGQGAVLQAFAGSGRVVLIGFRAQHRAQSHATFRLLFNAIHTHPRP